jgi:hypothetical protein
MVNDHTVGCFRHQELGGSPDVTPMRLATDYVHPMRGGGRCRLRIFVPDAEGERMGDAAVVVCSELPDNPGESVAERAEELAAEVLALYGEALPGFPVFVEHRPPETTDGARETFDLVVFAFGDARQTIREGAEGWRRELGPPLWKPLDRKTVEALVGQRV